jgi:hypothetical protein
MAVNPVSSHSHFTSIFFLVQLHAKVVKLVLSHNRNDSDAKKRNMIVDKGGIAMNDCTIMELHCLERARLDPLNRGKWIAQAERWHELSRAQSSWRRSPQQSMGAGPMATQPRQQG